MGSVFRGRGCESGGNSGSVFFVWMSVSAVFISQLLLFVAGMV